MDSTQFLQIFPEFDKLDKFPTERVDFWLSISVHQVNAARWGILTNQGIALLTAHYLVLDAGNSLSRSIPGGIEGIATSKSVDSVSKSMDVSAITLKDAGLYNKSTYGIQYYQLLLAFGAGPTCISGSFDTTGYASNQNTNTFYNPF